MYLNDVTAGKMEYYLDYTPRLVAEGCTDGRRADASRAEMQLTLLGAATTSRRCRRRSPGSANQAPKGWIRLNLRLYAPTGGD